MKVNTGYGYIKDANGKIISKYDLPRGEHPLSDGYTFVEVPSRNDLDKIQVDTPKQKELTIEEKLEKLGITKEELKEILK
jgi:hypothetical protein